MPIVLPGPGYAVGDAAALKQYVHLLLPTCEELYVAFLDINAKQRDVSPSPELAHDPSSVQITITNGFSPKLWAIVCVVVIFSMGSMTPESSLVINEGSEPPPPEIAPIASTNPEGNDRLPDVPPFDLIASATAIKSVSFIK
jgi:hypothetical protein